MTVLSRAYSTFEIKSIEEGERIIEGVASTPTPDRMQDIVRPLGAKFQLPIPYLWQHQHDAPVGHVIEAKPNKFKIPFRAKLAKTDELGRLKDRLDEAWQSIKLRLVAANSIGFKPLKWSFLEGGGIDFEEWDWMELSAVTIPANADAEITAIKSFDRELRAAAGIPELDYQLFAPSSADPEAALGQDPEPPAERSRAHVAKLHFKARDRAPFVIKRINHLR